VSASQQWTLGNYDIDNSKYEDIECSLIDKDGIYAQLFLVGFILAGLFLKRHYEVP
jgi:hypothetical protein